MRGGCRALRVPAGTETPASTAESCDSFNPFCEDDSTEGNVMKITGNESNSINARERLPIGINSNILYCIPEDVSRYVISFI